MTGDEALACLLDGNGRFARGEPDHPHQDSDRRHEQAADQTPFAAVLACADSRVAPELVFDQGIGDLFVVRVAGNTATDDITLGSLEFAIDVLHCPLLVVLGHEKCGAVTAAVDAVATGRRPGGHLDALIDPIVPVVEGTDLDAAVRANVRHQVTQLTGAFPQTTIVGARYALGSGVVDLVA